MAPSPSTAAKAATAATAHGGLSPSPVSPRPVAVQRSPLVARLRHQLAEGRARLIALANDSVLGLTAGVYSEDPAEVQKFLDTIEAGVVYVNRRAGATTGAWPGIQTFCGWKGSGMSGKGGLGSWYVPQFMREQSHTIFGSL